MAGAALWNKAIYSITSLQSTKSMNSDHTTNIICIVTSSLYYHTVNIYKVKWVTTVYVMITFNTILNRANLTCFHTKTDMYQTDKSYT